jgi:hypothetical protein
MNSKSLLVSALMLLGSAATTVTAGLPSETSAEAGKMLTPWDTAFAAFADDDASHPRPAGGVLFVGSSSIRLWTDLETQFKDAPVIIKRGFGGSQLSDCVKNLNRLVVRYRPRTVLVYAGDNDLAAGTAPAEVFRRFRAFVDGIHKELPDTDIHYISIKPSPSRMALLPQIRDTNRLIHEYADAQGKVEFIDVYTPMLDASGKPRPELFRADALHLNADGYALWKRVIGPHVH